MAAPLETTVQPLILREDAGGVATLTLNRPAQFNAINGAMLTALQSALDAIAGDAAVRVVVLAGAGRAFCPGHDLKEMLANSNAAFIGDLFRRCCDVMLSLQRLPQPVIGKVHGIATAAGCQLVAACDLAVCADDARFATSGINFGLFCATPGVGVAQRIAEARVRDADDRGIHRRADGARVGSRQPCCSADGARHCGAAFRRHRPRPQSPRDRAR